MTNKLRLLEQIDDMTMCGEFIEKGCEAPYREFDALGERRRNILTLIADRLQSEKASAQYRAVEAQPKVQARRPTKLNVRA